MKMIFAVLSFLTFAVQANASSTIFSCNDGSGYIQTSTQVWKDSTGKLLASVQVHDIENPGDYNVNLKAIYMVQKRDGTVIVASRVKGRYLLIVDASGKKAKLTATNISPIELTCFQ